MSDPTMRPRILVVDDDPKALIAVRSVLDDLDIDVVEVSTGEDALREVLRHSFTVILLDVRLPGMDGFETAMTIRQREKSRNIPIIFLTGIEDGEIQQNRGYELNAVDFMIKPVNAQSLRAKIRFAIEYRRELLSALEAHARQLTKIESLRSELETVFDAATSGIIALDSKGNIVRINNRARHMLGGVTKHTPFRWPEQIKFLDADTLQPLDDASNPLNRLLSGKMLRSETHLMRRVQSGEDRRYVRVDSALIENDRSGIHVVLVIDDVSNEERNRQVVERRSRLDALGQLTGGIAHDFNNLLASQLYAVDLARNAKDQTTRDVYLQTAATSIQRGRSLTSRLLSFARKQPGLATVRKTSEIFEEFSRLVRPMLEAHVEIVASVDDESLLHYCDQTQLETALMNLVLNSRDAILRAGTGNRIELRARAVRSPNTELDSTQENAAPVGTAPDGSTFRYVEVSVTDNGPGMDSETLARCTDPFFTTKDTNSGTGLGLAMVYGFARQSNGDLRIYSEPDIGTTVQLTLPRGTAEGLREDAMPEEHAEHGAGQIILIVEDEDLLLEMMRDVLEELDYRVITAKSGGEALKIANSGKPFDLLLTDIVMPGNISGFDLARRIREIRTDIPVIYTSGYTGFSTSEMGEVQAPLLQKPSPTAELAKAIADALGRGD